MHKTIATFGALILFAAAVRADEAPPADAPDWAAVPVVTLRKASADGAVTVSGSEPRSYTAVKLHLRNKTQQRVAVDLAGSFVVPKSRGSCQRLALGPAVVRRPDAERPPGTVVVELEPGAETDLVVNTCCMDAGLPSPTKQTFELAAEAMPPVREQVMRWWADNPTASQSAVNSAIWTNSGTVHLSPGVVANFVTPKGRFAAIRGGTYFELVDGVLKSIDSESVVRILGSEIFQVLPTDEGVYAVMLGDDRKPKLWRLGVTGEHRWAKVMDLDDTNRIADVLSGGKGNLVLVTDKGIDFFDAKAGTTTRSLETEQLVHLSVRRAGEDRLTVTIRRPPKLPTYVGGEPKYESSPVYELWTVSLANGTAEREQSFWNVGAMLTGPAGTFALSHTEKQLRRLTGGKFADLTDARFRRIVAVAKDFLWMADDDSRLVAADARTGKVRFRTEVVTSEKDVFAMDPATGDLAFVREDRFHRVSGETGVLQQVEER